MFLWLTIACSDQALNPVEVRDTEYPDEIPSDVAECPLLEFCWDAPVEGELRIEGELSDADGNVVLPWSLAEEQTSDGWTVCAEYVLCDDVSYYRGEGIANADEDASDDLWSCTLTDEGFAFTGEVYFWLDGVQLSPETVPDPTSDGCGVGVQLESVTEEL